MIVAHMKAGSERTLYAAWQDDARRALEAGGAGS